MPKTHKVGEQWASCDVCDIITPMSRLIIEDGLKKCDRAGCRDEFMRNDIHLRLVARILQAPTEEQTDRRHKLYYQPTDWDEVI